MKKGISLIVLVITIIVMIILAASVVITLNNTGVIDKASQAVDLTNESQVQDLAALIWADAYMDNLRGEALVTEVKTKLEQQGIKDADWNVDITNAGVTITKNNLLSIQSLANVAWNEANNDGNSNIEELVIEKLETSNIDITDYAITFSDTGVSLKYAGLYDATTGTFSKSWKSLLASNYISVIEIDTGGSDLDIELKAIDKNQLKGELVVPTHIGIEYIGDFSGCNELTSLIIPEGVVGINENALVNSGIRTISWPKTLTNVSGQNGARIETVYYNGTIDEIYQLLTIIDSDAGGGRSGMSPINWLMDYESEMNGEMRAWNASIICTDGTTNAFYIYFA